MPVDAPRVLILDFDGVVIESNEVKTCAFEQVFARFPEHKDEMMGFHHANVSLGRAEKFRHLQALTHRQGDDRFLADVLGEFSSLVMAEMAKVPFVVGAVDFLATASRKLPLYLASMTPSSELAQILEMRSLRRWFRGVYGCPPWNKVDAIRDIMGIEGITAQEALFIGDSAGDQRAALSTGVPFIARDSGLTFDPPLPLMFKDLGAISDFLGMGRT